jgi:hypothetical protein
MLLWLTTNISISNNFSKVSENIHDKLFSYFKFKLQPLNTDLLNKSQL